VARLWHDHVRIDKYLRGYADPRCAHLVEELRRQEALSSERPWGDVVVVPAREESAEQLEMCIQKPAARSAERSLLVVVVNGIEGVPSHENSRLQARWCGEGAQGKGVWLHREGDFDRMIVDCSSGGRGFLPRDGVGLARKIGADLALSLMRGGWVRDTWIHMTDADASLSAEHFDAAKGVREEFVARVARFCHVPSGDSQVDDATWSYERWLRYFVLGLRFAGSQYAHHSIGSLISVRAGAYAAVRGVPRRQAGEDFYLLDKLRKIGPILCNEGERVRIAARRSSRVPFGTGPAVEALMTDPEGRMYPDPRGFTALRSWISLLDRLGRGERTPSDSWLRDELDDRLVGCLSRLGYDASVEGLCRRYKPPVLGRQIRTWFDGLRTLRLLHALRDDCWPDIPWSSALRADFLVGKRRLQALVCSRIHCEAMEALEGRTLAE